MADTLYFSRDTEVFVKIGSAIWEIPVLDGFSFSQGTNTSEITLNEMADASGNSKRGRQMFTDSYAPAEWSFSTYARPFASAADASGGVADTAAKHHAVEEVLWALMVGDAAYASNTFTGFTADGKFKRGSITKRIPTEIEKGEKLYLVAKFKKRFQQITTTIWNGLHGSTTTTLTNNS